MRILMYGWEFPPFHSGGLGVACKGIVEGLIHHGTDVSLVLPYIPESGRQLMPTYCIAVGEMLKGALSGNVLTSAIVSPYISENEFDKSHLTLEGQKSKRAFYGNNLIEEALKYGDIAGKIAEKIPHDVIHVHDWMTYPAGIAAKNYSNAPLVMHIHSTEFDRSADNPNPAVYDIEKRGFHEADMIIAVSNYTKQKIVEKYGINEEKIKVLHNAIDPQLLCKYYPSPIKKNDKIVLFLGRVTIQKGPDYFIQMAKRVLEKRKNVKFIMAGKGDMLNEMIRQSINLGIDKNILFSGFLSGKDIKRAYQNADLFVMPSVSEPFGLTALESVQNGTPVLISKQSGVSEVLLNTLKVDFWDVDEMANKVLSLLKYPNLSKALKKQASHELHKFSWRNVGEKLNNHYQSLIAAYA